MGARLRVMDKAMRKQRRTLRGTLYEYTFVGVFTFFITLVLTNFTLLNGTHQLFIEGPGDGTAGFLWLNSIDSDLDPGLPHTDMANFPVGEDLSNPTYVTYSAVMLPLWLVSRLFGPVMGLNIVTFFGFWSCALTSYWLVKKLTNDPLASLFAAYVATYTPYHLIKSSAHLTYIFSAVFVLVLAAFIGYWTRPSYKRAILLAASLALAFYTDGYFILIGSIFVLALLVAGVVYDALGGRLKKLFVVRLKHAGVAVAVLALLLIPVGITQLTQGSKVGGHLSSARGNIAFDIEYYSSHLMDFITPAPLNPFLKDNADFQAIVAHQNRRSNSSENVTYIGWTLILLIMIGLALLVSRLLSRKNSHFRDYPYIENIKFIYAVGIVTVPILAACMLSPSFTVFGLSIMTLGDVLLHFDIALWRVMARFYLPLHVMVSVMSAVSLAAIVHRYKPKYLTLNARELRGRAGIYLTIITIAIVFAAAEYASVNSRPSYDFNNIPKVYSWIRDQPDIKVIAELPLVDRPLSVNYDFATAQIVHGKKLVNTPLTRNIPGGRTALGDVDSREAVDYAIARGADTIVTHNSSCSDREWGRVVYHDDNAKRTRESAYYGSPICVYAINNTYEPDALFIQLVHGTFSDEPYVDMHDRGRYQMIYSSEGQLMVVDALGGRPGGIAVMTARIGSNPGAQPFQGKWTVHQGGVSVASGNIPGDIKIEGLDVSQPIQIRVSDTQGGAPDVFQVSLSRIVVSRLPTGQ